MRLSLRPLLPNETDWESLSVFVLIPSALIGRIWLHLGLPLPACTFKHFTGCPCPGCGATRAAHALLHGDVSAALKLNPLATLLAFATGIGCLYASIILLKGKRRWRADGLPRGTALVVRLLIVLGVLANWAWVVTHLPESPWRNA